jgi:hypothetical protein
MHAFHDNAGSKFRNRKAGIELIALTTHKTPGVYSSHARSGDSIEDSIELLTQQGLTDMEKQH